jgi:preprotein translocase subunit SecY
MSVFALAIMPYITASIVIQLLSIAYKPLENLKKEGEIGRRKINAYSRYLTVLLASFQGYGVAVGLESVMTPVGSVVINSGMFFRFTTVVTLVVGTILLMWLGEQITARGIGSGTSLIIFVGIVSGIPASVVNLFELSRKGAVSPLAVVLVFLGVAVIVSLVVFFEKAQRRVSIQYPKRQVGRKIYGGDVSHMPLKLNTAGVIPPIFAGSILLFPVTLANLSGGSEDGWVSFFSYYLSHGRPLYVLCYVVLIVFFSFFYTAIVFNAEETALNLKKYGAYLPGRRPGVHTAEYFDYLLIRLTVLGSVYLSCICVLPEIAMSKYAISLSLSGTSFLIVVNVVLDTFTQIQTYMFNSKYETLVKKMKIKK